MKRFIALLSTIVMMFGLTACGGGGEEKAEPSSTESEVVKKEENKPKEEVVTKVEIVNERVMKYMNGLDKPEALYLAELKNTGSDTVKISDISIDLEDASGSILNTTSMLNSYPNTLNPGESAYICESLLSLDSKESLDDIGNAILHYDFDKASVKPLNVEITETKLTTEYGFPKIVGRIENKSDEELTMLYIACPIFSEDGELLTVVFTIVDSLKPTEKLGFEQMAIFCDTNIDYSNCTFKTIPFNMF